MAKENETKIVKGYPVAESDGRYYVDTTQGVQERLVWSQEERDGIYIIVDEMDDEIQLLVDESTYADACEGLGIVVQYDCGYLYSIKGRHRG